jgi:hypothetical protein
MKDKSIENNATAYKYKNNERLYRNKFYLMKEVKAFEN